MNFSSEVPCPDRVTCVEGYSIYWLGGGLLYVAQASLVLFAILNIQMIKMCTRQYNKLCTLNMFFLFQFYFTIKFTFFVLPITKPIISV
jgi:hypothetical protein